MIIVGIQFDRALTIPGKRPTTDVAPADPTWEGWSFRVQGDRLVITSPPGDLALSDSMKAEIGANGLAADSVCLVLSEPLERVRLTCLRPDDAEPWPAEVVGPSQAVQDVHRAKREATAKANAEVAARAAEAASQPRQKPKSEPRAAAANGPKRPGWARKDPAPPPSPPEEDAP